MDQRYRTETVLFQGIPGSLRGDTLRINLDASNYETSSALPCPLLSRSRVSMSICMSATIFSCRSFALSTLALL